MPFTYTITFPLTMGNVPEIEVYLSDIPVSVITLEEGNILGGFFRLEYDGAIFRSHGMISNDNKMLHLYASAHILI